MSAQWFNPLDDTPEGRLLKDVQDLLKGVKNKDKADLDKDGKLSGYEKKRAKAIESSMAKDGYKSDRGQKPAPKLPSSKGSKTVIKFDMSDNCPFCGANPHEECGKMGMNHEMRAIDCMKNPIAFDSRFDDARQHSIREHIDEGHGRGTLIVRSDDKRDTSCDNCGKTEVSGVDRQGRCFECRKKANPDYYKSSPKSALKKNTECSVCNSQLDKNFECSVCNSEGEVKKYSQESSVDNLFPRFQNVDGGMPVNAHGFTTNQTYPATNDGPKKSIVSETAKMPAFAKTEYTPKGSSLHMHYNDAGGTRANPPNIDTIEQRLASLTKHAGRNNLGMIGEIEGLLKQVKDHLTKKDDDDKYQCSDCDKMFTAINPTDKGQFCSQCINKHPNAKPHSSEDYGFMRDDWKKD